MKRILYSVPRVLLVVGIIVTAANASHNADWHAKMDVLFTSPNAAVNSDVAFWGNHAFVSYYRGDSQASGGFRIFDISNPAGPDLLRDVQCDGPQADPIVWDRNGNGIADLLLLGVDRTMTGPDCGAPRAAHDDPAGWEGIRVFTLSDDAANPFSEIQQVAAVYTDCGAQAITLWPGETDQGRLIVYVSSYPLRPGPTCGGTQYLNTANPYDGDPLSPTDPLHGVIQVVEVPLDNPAGAHEIAQLPITYPGDPDGRIDWCERGGSFCPPVFESAARGCHDIVVHVPRRLAAAACGEQGQLWAIDENGIPDTENPILIVDDEISSGGAGSIPGAVDLFGSATFNDDVTVVTWSDVSFGAGCPPRTFWQPRPWNPAGGTHATGRLFLFDPATGELLSEVQVGNSRPETAPNSYCSARRSRTIGGLNRDFLVSAWHTGGVNVLDLTRPRAPKEIAFYDFAPAGPMGSYSLAAYAYTGPAFRMGAGIPVYATDGAGNTAAARGLVVFRTLVEKVGNRGVDHLNPQTID
jgi:hypothetical protein